MKSNCILDVISKNITTSLMPIRIKFSCFLLSPQPSGLSAKLGKGPLTLHLSQQEPWAHSAPSLRVQLEALQQGLLHSWEGNGASISWARGREAHPQPCPTHFLEPLAKKKKKIT